MKLDEYKDKLNSYENRFLNYLQGEKDDTGLSSFARIPSAYEYEKLLDRYGVDNIKSIVGSQDSFGGYAVPPSIIETAYYDLYDNGLLRNTTNVNVTSRAIGMPTISVDASTAKTKADTRNTSYRSTFQFGNVELLTRPVEFDVPFSRAWMEDAPSRAKDALGSALAEAMTGAHHDRIVTGSTNDSVKGIVPSGTNAFSLPSSTGALNMATLVAGKFALPWRARTTDSTVLIGNATTGATIQQLNSEITLSIGHPISAFDKNISWYESETLPNNILILGDMKSYAFAFTNMRIKSYVDSYSGENGILSASVYSAGGILYPARFHIISLT